MVAQKYHQAYFKTSGDHIRYQDDRCPQFKMQRLRAEIKEAEWLAESALSQYRRFVSENHPTTHPLRQTGVHGLTCDFRRDRRGKWQAGFAVNIPDRASDADNGRSVRFYTFRTRRYSETWEYCVNLWAELNDVLDEDRRRVLLNPPPAERFKELRRHLNEAGEDIPVEALGAVFREQREAILASKSNIQPASPISSSPEVSERLAGEMAAWFEAARSNA
ncbi:hypothetical protein AQ621_16695 (plasmid) [Marinobacter sp. P4B1]|nr:hypothetical protein AQ621_16695 [Marinobacter sp. P4B1]